VQRGQALLRVRDTELRERLKQAEAGLQIAEARAEQAEASLTQLQAQFDRAKALAERNMSSQAEIDNITADLASAQANLSLANAQVVQARSSVDEANLNLSRTVIRSPVSGLVGQRGIEPGQLISANTRLFIVGDPNNLRITTVLTERMITYIREGMKVTVSNPSTPDSVIDATISRISPFLDPVTHTTTAEIDIKNTGDFLLPGMFATVDVFYGQSQSATLVPNSAIYRHPLTGIEGVYIARSIGSEIQPVTDVDATAPPPLTDVTPVEFVEINVLAKGREVSGVTGIQGGAWIVTVGQNLLAGGAKEARVRTVAWDRILELQLLTEEDLLRSVMRENADRAATAANTSM
jgi:RND family efflux transporter MFP subunit